MKKPGWLPSSTSEAIGNALAMIACQGASYLWLGNPPEMVTFAWMLAGVLLNWAAYRVADRIIYRREMRRKEKA